MNKAAGKLKICFVLPGYTRQPIGGFRMVYDYANHLQKRGYTVLLLCINQNIMKRYPLPLPIKNVIANHFTKTEPKWFPLNKEIKKVSALRSDYKKYLDDVDAAVATSVDSAEFTSKTFKSAKKAYFIQDYENWNVSDKYCQNTYKLGMTNIVISDWLKGIVDKYSKTPSILIKDPIDLDVYRISTSPEKRKPHTIGLLYHTMPHKGLKYSLAAIKKLKKKYPNLEVYMFGVPSRPKNFPEWIHYTKEATQQQTVEIYNKVSVWLCATVDEGYGLTGLEAMACGDALVSTAYTGVLEYAKDGYNALLSPVKDVDALVKNVQRVFEEDELRNKLVRNAQESVKEFSWDIAVERFEEALKMLQ